ncbi:MAG: TIM barrel protein [Anaerolineae bacterium]
MARGFAPVEISGSTRSSWPWVHNVSVKPDSGAKIRAAADALGARLSVHAPYYINLNSGARQGRGQHPARSSWPGAARRGSGRNVVLHLGFYHAGDRADVYARVRDGLAEAAGRLAACTDVDASAVCPAAELMGRVSQFGDLDEVLRLCQDVPGCAPCIDVAHWHARTGAYNTAAEFESLFRSVADALGRRALPGRPRPHQQHRCRPLSENTCTSRAATSMRAPFLEASRPSRPAGHGRRREPGAGARRALADRAAARGAPWIAVSSPPGARRGPTEGRLRP